MQCPECGAALTDWPWQDGGWKGVACTGCGQHWWSDQFAELAGVAVARVITELLLVQPFPTDAVTDADQQRRWDARETPPPASAWDTLTPREQADVLASSAQDARRFQVLAEQWRAERPVCSSSLSEICGTPAYEQIIRMGTLAVPHILRELQREPDHWFVALRIITGEVAHADAAAGNLPAMAKAWLAWGQDHGYLP